MITKISKANYSVFKNFVWPVGLEEFKDYNLIYGWNGSGKTTLSNLFRCIQLRKANGQSFTFQCSDSIIDSNSLENNQNLPSVRVFNKDFVDDNVFTSHKGVTPIFFIGKDSIDVQIEIEELKNLEAELQGIWSELNNKNKSEASALAKHCQVFGGNVKRLLTSPGEKTVYSNYDKSNAVKGFDKLLRDGRPSELSDSEENELIYTSREKIIDLITPIPLFKINLAKELSDTRDMLSTSVVSKVIDRFKEDGNLNEWAKKGAVIQGRVAGSNCIFCGQPYPEGFLSDLEMHFDESFKSFIGNIDAAIERLNSKKKMFNVSFPDKTRLYVKLRERYASELGEFDFEKKLAIDFINELISALNNKKMCPFEKMECNISAPRESLETRVFAIGSIIEENNLITENFEKHVKEARQALEQNELLRGVETYKFFNDNLNRFTCCEKEVEKCISEIKKKISVLESAITETKRPAEEINNDLISYLGRDEIRFEDMTSGYQILRNGKKAEALSEGERAGIAFTYFMKSLEDKDFDLQEGVVVIDDPVSSLDTNALFYAFGFMKARTESAGQLFVLTHNYSFFRQVKNWFYNVHRYRKKINRDASFYMLTCSGNTCDRVYRDSIHLTLPPLAG